MVLGRDLISAVLLEGDPDFSYLATLQLDWTVLLRLPSGWTRPTLPDVTWITVTHKQCGGQRTIAIICTRMENLVDLQSWRLWYENDIVTSLVDTLSFV